VTTDAPHVMCFSYFIAQNKNEYATNAQLTLSIIFTSIDFVLHFFLLHKDVIIRKVAQTKVCMFIYADHEMDQGKTQIVIYKSELVQ
jgi:hypothetical protein